MAKKSKEFKEQLRQIRLALKEFPKIIKQDEMRGREHRAIMKAFEPMARDLEKRIKKSEKK